MLKGLDESVNGVPRKQRKKEQRLLMLLESVFVIFIQVTILEEYVS